MKSKLFLQSIECNQVQNKYQESYFTGYESESIANLNRYGVFHTLFNKMFDNDEKIPHVLLSRFDLFKDVSLFYRVQSNSKMIDFKSSTLIIVFQLNFLETPLGLLKDFLMWLKRHYLNNYPDMKILGHYHYQIDINNCQEQTYVLNYFQLIQNYLGQLPDSISSIDLEKRATFKNFSVVEAGTQWSCLDNYFVHLICSKGGNFIQVDSNQAEFEIVKSEQLSPNHSIQQVRKTTNHKPDLSCSFSTELRTKNFIKNPQEIRLFNYLMYQDIFGAGKS